LSTQLENTRTGIKGWTPEISHILMICWFEPVLYLDLVSKCPFPETTARPGYFVGFAYNVGDALTFKILQNDLVTVLHRSVRDQQQMPVIGIEEYHLSHTYKNQLNY
jgi:hypothetical protein